MKLLPTSTVEKIFGHFFDRRMAEVKLENDRTIERLRSDLKHTEDRAIRLNQLEFDALSQYWDVFASAFLALRSIGTNLRTTPNFNGMSPEMIEEFIPSPEWNDYQRKAFLQSNHKNFAYGPLVVSVQINKAYEELVKARDIFHRRSVFISDSIAGPLENELQQLFSIQVEVRERFKVDFDQYETDALRGLKSDKGQAKLEEFRSLVRTRLLLTSGKT